MKSRDREGTALEVFRQALDASKIGEQLGMTPRIAQRTWRKVRKQLARERLTERAARELAAETDEFFATLERWAAQTLVAYDGGAEKLSGYAAVVRQLKEIRTARIQILQDLRLLPTARQLRTESRRQDEPASKPALPEPSVPSSVADLTLDDLDAEIQALQLERDRRRLAVKA